jgi:hypothetical protein
MRVIEEKHECNCGKCGGKESLVRIELRADGPKDIEQLERHSRQIRAEAAESGRPVKEEHITLNAASQAKAEVAKWN